jgi:GT2 family glycosyltransferase
MKGDAVSYGEDTFLQTRLKAQGCRIGFDPDLVIRHLVPVYKMHVRWFLRSAFQRGKVSWMSVGKEPSALNFLRLFKIMFYDAAYTVVPSTRRLLRGECFIQNWVIDILRPQAKNLGTLCGAAVMLLGRGSSCADQPPAGKN